jgi:hypothetical protein
MMFDKAFLADIKDRLPLETVAGRYVKLTKSGQEYRGLSPFTVERSPSFFISPRKQAFFDFSAGHNGDLFRFLMLIHGLSFPDVVAQCALDAGVTIPYGLNSDTKAFSKTAFDSEAWRRNHQSKIEAEERRKNRVRELAYSLWKEGRNIVSDPAGLYLDRRGIGFGRECKSLRYHPALEHRDPGTGEVTNHPALIAAVQSPEDGRFLALWRIFLTEDGQKAPLPNPKLGLGSYADKGGCVRLGRPTERSNVCEGIETGLGIMGILGRSQGVQAAMATSGMVSFIPPSGTKSVLIWPDGDTDRIRENRQTHREEWVESPGMRAAHTLKDRLDSEGVPASIQFTSKKGKDWLDIFNAGKNI